MGEPLFITAWLGEASNFVGDEYIGIPLCFRVNVCVFLDESLSIRFSLDDVTDDWRDREYTLLADEACPGAVRLFEPDNVLLAILPVVCNELLEEELDIFPLTPLD